MPRMPIGGSPMTIKGTLFSAAQLAELRAKYDTLETIDPAAFYYQCLINVLDTAGQPRLKQLAGAGIKFVSKLAANRVIKPE